MTHDLIIIGAGPGGYETAMAAASAGNKVALIERDRLGGTCLNRGCIPTKALCRSAEMAVSMREAGDFGIGLSTSEINIDYRAIAGRKDAVVAQLREGVAELLKGVEVISGEARFVSTCGVEVNGDIHTAPRIIDRKSVV
nr:FAD-dependent oxidoreductase [uncultured Duncaniella sp.]